MNSTAQPPPPAVILAAGRGDRLLPLTREIPKCLLKVGPRTILEHQIQALRLAGVERIQIITGHGAEHIRETVDDAIAFAHNDDYDQTNSFVSLGFATLEAKTEGLLVLNSDVLFHPDLLRRLLNDPRENVLLADFDVELGEEEMKIKADSEGLILRISKGISPADGQAENLGVLRLGPRAAGRMLELARDRDAHHGIRWVPDGIQYLIGEFEFHALPTEGVAWIEMDFKHDLERARDEVFPMIAPALWEEPIAGRKV